MGTVRGDGVRCTVVIPTFNRWEMAMRAIESVESQSERTLSIIANGGRNPPFTLETRSDYVHVPDNGQPSNLSWYVGANLVETDYMAFLYDDDWYEPTFIERCCDMLDAGNYFAFSNATLHNSDGTTRPNFTDIEGDRVMEGDTLVELIRQMPLTISPGCCVFRTQTVLDHLRVSRIPGTRYNRSLVGPDKLLLLMAAAEAETVGIIGDCLVNFDGHDDSTTIKASKTREGTDRLLDDYARVVKYFDLLVRGDG